MLLPRLEDNHPLRQEFKGIVGNVLMKYVKELPWMRKFIPEHITHEYTRLTKMNTHTVTHSTIFFLRVFLATPTSLTNLFSQVHTILVSGSATAGDWGPPPNSKKSEKLSKGNGIKLVMGMPLDGKIVSKSPLLTSIGFFRAGAATYRWMALRWSDFPNIRVLDA